jgi:CheY-like chemotaxis protein
VACGKAVNGIAAMEKARRLNPDLIPSDYSMAVMNGIETGAVLSGDRYSGYVYRVDRQEGLAIESAAIAVSIRAVRRAENGLGEFARHLGSLLGS